MAEIRSQKERVKHRLGDAEKQENARRVQSLSALLKSVSAREDRMKEAVERISDFMAKIEAFLLECKAKVERLDGPLGDAELVRDIEAGGE